MAEPVAGNSNSKRRANAMPAMANHLLTCSVIMPWLLDSCFRPSTRKTGLLSATAQQHNSLVLGPAPTPSQRIKHEFQKQA
jgi:hypothetical protein